MKTIHPLVLLVFGVLLLGCGGGGGSGGTAPYDDGGGGGGGSYGQNASLLDFRSTNDFRENWAVQRLLDEGGLYLSDAVSPPDVEGYYDYSGRIVHSDLAPELVGRTLQGALTFFDQQGLLISITEHSQVFGDITAHGYFINGSGSSFTIAYAVEATVDVGGVPCTETDVGIINGTVRGDGGLDLRIGFVAVGISGACVALLAQQGYTLDQLLGKPHVTVCTAHP